MTATDEIAMEIDRVADAFFGALEEGSVTGVVACFEVSRSTRHNVASRNAAAIQPLLPPRLAAT